MEEKKYEMLKDYATKIGEHVLYRIKALIDFGDVKTGDIGGFIEKEENLSHSGNCWIYNDAKVLCNAKVSDNAIVYGDAMVHGNAKIWDGAKICSYAVVCDDADVSANAMVCGDAMVCGTSMINGNTRVYGNAIIYGNAYIFSNSCYCLIQGFGPHSTTTTTFFICKDAMIRVSSGLFEGTLDEFRAKVKEIYEDTKYAKEYLMAADLAELRLSIP